ncbi:hypothetical protein NBRC116597_44370 [Phaeobacter sp. NW0010-22]
MTYTKSQKKGVVRQDLKTQLSLCLYEQETGRFTELDVIYLSGTITGGGDNRGSKTFIIHGSESHDYAFVPCSGVGGLLFLCRGRFKRSSPDDNNPPQGVLGIADFGAYSRPERYTHSSKYENLGGLSGDGWT